MKDFVDKYTDRIQGVLSCFDRMFVTWVTADHVGLGDGGVSEQSGSEIQQPEAARSRPIVLSLVLETMP